MQPFYIQSIQDKAMQKIEVAITSSLIERKKKWVAVAEEQNTPEPESNRNKIKKDITNQISISGCNIVRKNSLIITSHGLLYLNFTYTCHTSHNRRIKQ